MARKRAKPSQTVFIWAALIAVPCVAGLNYLTKWQMPWWLVLILWLAIAGAGYQTLLRVTADERIADRDHDPDNPRS